MKRTKSNVTLIPIKLYLQKATSHLDHLPLRKAFSQWVKSALQIAEKLHSYKNIEITIRLVDEKESAYLNEQYRTKKGPTNILSFAGGPDPTNQEFYLGDLVICVPLVFTEAQEQNKLPLNHFAHLTVHGVLHLLGYDHMKEKEARVMEALEVKILRKLGFKNPYISA